MNVIFEDDYLLVVDKPHGQHTQPPAQGPDESVLAEAQRTRRRARVRIVHRLDRDAGGLLVLAKGKLAAAELSEAFRSHTAKRIYRAAIAVPLVVGTSGVIDAPLKWAGGKCWVDASGASALTRYVVTSRDGGLTWLEVEIETGRMHQIRVHLKHALGPIIGDRKYGGAQADHLHLQAVKLTLPHPETGVLRTFEIQG